MRRLLFGLGIALFGSFCALGWQVLALSALGWLGGRHERIPDASGAVSTR